MRKWNRRDASHGVGKIEQRIRKTTQVLLTDRAQRAIASHCWAANGVDCRSTGFDLGNSPCEFTPETVAGRTIVFTTTNGTQALLICTAAERVLIGSFVNFSAVVKELDGELPIHLLCAGTRGRVTREDVLFAGALVEKLAGTDCRRRGAER